MILFKFRLPLEARVHPNPRSPSLQVPPIGAGSAGLGAWEGRDPGLPQRGGHTRRRRFQRPRGAKNLEKTKSGLADLQRLEIAQNRQRNVWKSLQKKGKKRGGTGKVWQKPWRPSALAGVRHAPSNLPPRPAPSTNLRAPETPSAATTGAPIRPSSRKASESGRNHWR